MPSPVSYTLSEHIPPLHPPHCITKQSFHVEIKESLERRRMDVKLDLDDISPMATHLEQPLPHWLFYHVELSPL
ncbi:hypothetical protein BDQ17DRAFT_1428205 [Cyathus striatus]|nr:hypothetical protein BDQ17DRAFT_1428205 [Cyathus striatus]